MTIKCNAINTVKTTEFFFTSISGQYSKKFSIFSCTQKEPYVEFVFFFSFFDSMKPESLLPGRIKLKKQ